MPSVESRKSIIDLADESGLFDINASDLVCESSANGICYYDFVLSSRIAGPRDGGSKLFLAKFDNKINLEFFETALISNELFEDGLPQSDIALMTLGILTWKHLIAKSRVLCLVRSMDGDCSQALEALKRATHKFSCLHHVQATGRRNSTSSNSSHGSTLSVYNEGMKMRIMLCQSRSVVETIPTQAIRETKALLNPSSNPILCICFPIS